MELKDVILSTLAEMEEPIKEKEQVQKIRKIESSIVEKKEIKSVEKVQNESSLDGELLYLDSIRERLLVLFEGFQSPNNTNVEAKIDMTLNFLEYTLATIDNRIKTLRKGEKYE